MSSSGSLHQPSSRIGSSNSSTIRSSPSVNNSVSPIVTFAKHFPGHIEIQEDLSSIAKQLRLKRIQEVRRNEKLISRKRCQDYRQKIDERKEMKETQQKQIKLQAKMQEREVLVSKWQNTMIEAGQAHRYAKHELVEQEDHRQKKMIKTQVTEQNILQRHHEAVKIIKHQQVERDKKEDFAHYLKHLRDEERQSTREDAHQFGEQIAIQTAKKKLMDEEQARKNLTNIKYMLPHEKIVQSAEHVDQRFPVHVEARIIKHGVLPNDGVIFNAASTQERQTTQENWSAVMTEMKQKNAVKVRAVKAREVQKKAKGIAFLEEELKILAAVDRSGSRLHRVKETQQVKEDQENKVIRDSFEKIFMATSFPNHAKDDVFMPPSPPQFAPTPKRRVPSQHSEHDQRKLQRQFWVDFSERPQVNEEEDHRSVTSRSTFAEEDSLDKSFDEHWLKESQYQPPNVGHRNSLEPIVENHTDDESLSPDTSRIISRHMPDWRRLEVPSPFNGMDGAPIISHQDESFGTNNDEESEGEEFGDAVDYFHHELDADLQRRDESSQRSQPELAIMSHQQPEANAHLSTRATSVQSPNSKSPKRVTIIEFNDSSLSEEPVDHPINDDPNQTTLTALLDDEQIDPHPANLIHGNAIKDPVVSNNPTTTEGTNDLQCHNLALTSQEQGFTFHLSNDIASVSSLGASIDSSISSASRSSISSAFARDVGHSQPHAPVRSNSQSSSSVSSINFEDRQTALPKNENKVGSANTSVSSAKGSSSKVAYESPSTNHLLNDMNVVQSSANPMHEDLLREQRERQYLQDRERIQQEFMQERLRVTKIQEEREKRLLQLQEEEQRRRSQLMAYQMQLRATARGPLEEKSRENSDIEKVNLLPRNNISGSEDGSSSSSFDRALRSAAILTGRPLGSSVTPNYQDSSSDSSLTVDFPAAYPSLQHGSSPLQKSSASSMSIPVPNALTSISTLAKHVVGKSDTKYVVSPRSSVQSSNSSTSISTGKLLEMNAPSTSISIESSRPNRCKPQRSNSEDSVDSLSRSDFAADLTGRILHDISALSVDDNSSVSSSDGHMLHVLTQNHQHQRSSLVTTNSATDAAYHAALFGDDHDNESESSVDNHQRSRSVNQSGAMTDLSAASPLFNKLYRESSVQVNELKQKTSSLANVSGGQSSQSKIDDSTMLNISALSASSSEELVYQQSTTYHQDISSSSGKSYLSNNSSSLSSAAAKVAAELHSQAMNHAISDIQSEILEMRKRLMLAVSYPNPGAAAVMTSSAVSYQTSNHVPVTATGHSLFTSSNSQAPSLLPQARGRKGLLEQPSSAPVWMSTESSDDSVEGYLQGRSPTYKMTSVSNISTTGYLTASSTAGTAPYSRGSGTMSSSMSGSMSGHYYQTTPTPLTMYSGRGVVPPTVDHDSDDEDKLEEGDLSMSSSLQSSVLQSSVQFSNVIGSASTNYGVGSSTAVTKLSSGARMEPRVQMENTSIRFTNYADDNSLSTGSFNSVSSSVDAPLYRDYAHSIHTPSKDTLSNYALNSTYTLSESQRSPTQYIISPSSSEQSGTGRRPIINYYHESSSESSSPL